MALVPPILLSSAVLFERWYADGRLVVREEILELFFQ
jgi:hypothetical protein